MSAVNKAIILGNVGQNPETRTLENGRQVTTFSVATNEKYKNKEGEKVENTTWHNIVAWTPFSEIINSYVKKGDKLYIEGKITNRTWEDKNNIKRYTTEIVVRELTLLGSNNSAKPPQPTEEDAPPWTQSQSSDLEQDDDLPF